MWVSGVRGDGGGSPRLWGGGHTTGEQHVLGWGRTPSTGPPPALPLLPVTPHGPHSHLLWVTMCPPHRGGGLKQGSRVARPQTWVRGGVTPVPRCQVLPPGLVPVGVPIPVPVAVTGSRGVTAGRWQAGTPRGQPRGGDRDPVGTGAAPQSPSEPQGRPGTSTGMWGLGVLVPLLGGEWWGHGGGGQGQRGRRLGPCGLVAWGGGH